MRISYPRSFLSLLLIGFSIVAAPLLFALFSNALAFERLAGLSEQAVHSAVKVTQASRALLTVITSLERSARQYAVAGEATFLEAYRANRASFLRITKNLDNMALSDNQRSEVAAIERQEEGINQVITRTGPTPELSRRLPREFATLAERAQSLVTMGDRVIDEGIEQLRAEAEKSRNNVFWLMIALIPTAVILIASFTFLISRPITQVTESIRGLGEGQQVRVGDLQITAFSTPGHADAHNCYLVESTVRPPGPAVLISGDLIFAGSLGGGYFCCQRQLTHSRRILSMLGDDTLIAPGHGPLTTAANERRFNPFLAH